MSNPIEIMIQNILSKGNQYGEMYAQEILKNNPQFAQQIQGQDLRKLGQEGLKQAGFDPKTFMNGMFNK